MARRPSRNLMSCGGHELAEPERPAANFFRNDVPKTRAIHAIGPASLQRLTQRPDLSSATLYRHALGRSAHQRQALCWLRAPARALHADHWLRHLPALRTVRARVEGARTSQDSATSAQMVAVLSRCWCQFTHPAGIVAVRTGHDSDPREMPPQTTARSNADDTHPPRNNAHTSTLSPSSQTTITMTRRPATGRSRSQLTRGGPEVAEPERPAAKPQAVRREGTRR